MFPRRVGLDYDGVIVDHTETKIRAAQALGFAISESETSYDGLKNALGAELHRELQHITYDDPAFVFSSPLMPGALEALARLRDAGTECFVISRQKAPDIARESMVRHGLWGTFFGDHNVFFVSTSKDKDDKAKELGLQIYVDDDPHILAAMPSVPHRILFDPINYYPNDPTRVRVSDWPAVLSVLEQMTVNSR